MDFRCQQAGEDNTVPRERRPRGQSTWEGWPWTRKWTAGFCGEQTRGTDLEASVGEAGGAGSLAEAGRVIDCRNVKIVMAENGKGKTVRPVRLGGVCVG